MHSAFVCTWYQSKKLSGNPILCPFFSAAIMTAKSSSGIPASDPFDGSTAGLELRDRLFSLVLQEEGQGEVAARKPSQLPDSAAFMAKSGIKTNIRSARRICIFKRRRNHSKVIDPHVTTVDGSATQKKNLRRFMLILLVIVYFRRKSVCSFSSSLFK
ncbi:hypothetical protein U1Q18_041249 [Sarracenia purpurea var. burkii]